MKSFYQICEASGPTRRDFLRTASVVANPLMPWTQLVDALVKNPQDLIVQVAGLDDDDVFMSVGWLGQQMMKMFNIFSRQVTDIKGGGLDGYYGTDQVLQGKMSSANLDSFIKSLGKHIRVENNMKHVVDGLKRDIEYLKTADPEYVPMVKKRIKEAQEAIANGAIKLRIVDYKNDVVYTVVNRPNDPMGGHIISDILKEVRPFDQLKML